MPALAVGGLIGVVSVLIGLQCGGLDKCFFRAPPQAVAIVEPAEAAEPAVEEQRLTPDTIVVAEPVLTPEQVQAEQIASVIGGSFAALNANDQGWLQSASAATAVADAAPPAVEADQAAIEEGDGAGPAATATAPWAGETAAEAAIAVAAAPVVPLDRPEPLEVSAYANSSPTAPAVSAAAQDQLDAVAAAVEPEPQPEAAPAPEATEVATAEAPAASSDTRTIAGSGVNVRSGPGRSNGTLFTLRAGEKVKVLENQRGWLKITDDQNRTGWAYQTYMN